MSDPKLVEPVHIPVDQITRDFGGKRVMMGSNPQCPKHWHMLGSQRCPIHKNCAITEACSACIKEAE